MTTLPQTTPIRLPRPGTGTQLSLPTTAPVAVGGGQAPALGMTFGDMWRVICANAWLIILFLVLSSVAGYFINDYLEKHDSTYTATGVVQIPPRQSADPLHPAAPDDFGALDLEKQSDIARFRDENLIDDLLKDPDGEIRQTKWWTVTCEKDPEKARDLLGKNLTVDPCPGSILMRVAFTAAEKADTAVVVTAVVNQTMNVQKEFIRDKYDAERRQTAEYKNRYEIELRNAQSDVMSKCNELAQMGASPFGDGSGPKGAELQARVAERIQLQSIKIDVDSADASLREMREHGQTPPVVQRMVDEDRDVVSAKDMLDNLAMRMNDITNSGGPESPAYKMLVQQQEIWQKRLDDAKADKYARYSEEYSGEITAQKKSVDTKLDHCNSEIARLEGELADIANKTAAYRSRVDDMAVYKEFVKQYDQHLQLVDQMMRTNQQGAMEWFARPHVPSSRSFPKLSNIMTMAVVFGLALSLGIAFLRELTDTTVRSPRDIIRVGQMNLLGMVPHEADDPQSTGARLPLVIFEAPHSIMAEQLRQVRTRLQHAASLDTTRSILVTSPGPGDGKSTIAVNLAAGLALNGRRILLVDANFRRPELHRIFGIGNEAGFSDVLNDVNAFASMVRETSVPNLSVMASGQKPSNSTELLESQLLLDFIERALEEYDHVIFDSGPMLFVSESIALAPRVDGVVTVVRARSSSRGVLQRMRDGLKAVKAEHLGIVLNGVRSQAGGYYGRSIKTYYEYQNAD
jgi:capsular exopolysaccharide synthesis family protein